MRRVTTSRRAGLVARGLLLGGLLAWAWNGPLHAESPLRAGAESRAETPKLNAVDEAITPHVRIVPQRSGDEVFLVAQLQECAVACVTVNVELKNMRSSVPLPLVADLRQARTTVAILRTVDPSKPWSYRFVMKYQIGRRGARPEGDFLYRRPFASGDSFRVSQGFGGSFSHQPGTPNEYSVDWSMPEGTEVRAARGGVVAAVRQNQRLGGNDQAYFQTANFIIVEHPDGTLAEYMHLRRDGAVARVGQRVATGDLLGYSGNTGYSSGAHLHVRVYIVEPDGQARGLPVQWDVREKYRER